MPQAAPWKEVGEAKAMKAEAHTRNSESGSPAGGWPSVGIIGGYPPPYGGISVHVERLVGRLEKQGVSFVLYNNLSDVDRPPHVVRVSARKWVCALWFAWFCVRHRCRVVHLLIPNWIQRVLFGALARLRGGRYVVSIHGRSLSLSLAGSRFRSGLTKWALRQMDAVVACNPDIERECLEMVGLPREKVHMVPAFIPPDADAAAALPADVQAFIDGHEPLLTAVGWVGQVYEGADLYGIDMMVELVERLASDYPGLGLVLSVNGGDADDVEACVAECRRRVGNRMRLVTESLSDITRLMAGGDVFVRPSNTDGDSVAVREALFLGTPVVASDAVPRPAPSVLFRTRDMDDFEAKVRESLASQSELRARVAATPMADNAAAIADLYRDLVEGPER